MIIGVLLLWPLGQVVVMSFYRLNSVRQLRGDREWPWVGLGNYAEILSDPFFLTVLRNTVLFAAANVLLTMVLGTLVGLLLNRLGRKMATFVASCVMLAWATPALTGTIVWKWIFDDTSGLVTWLFNALPDGLSNGLFGRSDWTGYGWFNSPLLFFAILTLVVVWHSFPFIAVSVLAGLKSVPSELHEAARVDGAGPWRVVLEDHLPAAAPGLRDPDRALHDLGLQGLHPAVRAGRRHPGPADVHARPSTRTPRRSRRRRSTASARPSR